MSRKITTDRRRLLQATGTGLAAAIAGCIGGGGGGGDFASAVQELNLGSNWRQRRIERAMNNWPVEDRMQVPSGGETTWTNSGSFQSAVENDAWAPPDG